MAKETKLQSYAELKESKGDHEIADHFHKVSKILSARGVQQKDPDMRRMYFNDAGDHQHIGNLIRQGNKEHARHSFSNMDTGSRDHAFEVKGTSDAKHRRIAKYFGVKHKSER